MADLSIVILSFNTKELTLKCLKSIFQKKWKIKYKVIVVDNASGDGTVAAIRKLFPQVEVIVNEGNVGFAAGNNVALKRVHSKYSLLLNSDTMVLPGALDNLVDFMNRTDYGIASCQLADRNGGFQPNAGDLPFGWPFIFWISGGDDIILFLKEKLPSYHRKFKSFYDGEKEVGWVSGSVMIIRDLVLKKIGLLDENIFMYGEDTEYCIRARRAGFKVGWTDKAKIIHLGGGSTLDPSFKQWTGEFQGLLYIYKKYCDLSSRLMLRLLIYLSIFSRMVAFLITGKIQVTKTYAKVLISV